MASPVKSARACSSAIGAEVMPLYCDIDGTFPNHHPDPSEPHNLADLIEMVQRLEADIGIAFDGDGDRLGVVTRDGEIIFPDRLLMLFARRRARAQSGRRDHLRREVHRPPARADPAPRRQPDDVEDRPLADQGQDARRPMPNWPAR